MAKQVKLPKGKTFEFKRGGAASKYPWDTFLNGDLLMLTKGEDYDVETDAMAPKIKTAARRRYKKVDISHIDHEGNKLVDSLIIQARDMTPDEREAEDIKRAEEKAKRAEAESNGEPHEEAAE